MPVSRSCSNIGKSTTQSRSWRSPAARSKRSASSSRSSPSTSAATGARSATTNSTSPGPASRRCAIAARSSSERNLAIGERQPPPSSTNAHTRPLAPHSIGLLGEAVEVGTRKLARPCVQPPHHAARGQRAREHLELRRPQRLAEILDLEPEAGVGAVRAVAEHRLVVGQPRVGRRRHAGEARGLEHRRHQPLDQADDVLLLHERQLDVELGELGQPVGARVLVAEAAGDLVVALEPADHQQLLEQLRRLGQGEEAARPHPRGHDEVARALGRRAGQDRRLEVEEVVRAEVVADGGDDLVAADHRVAHALATQIQCAMAQAQRLVDVGVLVDRERRRLGVGQELEVGHVELDLARGQPRVDVGLVAAGDGALRGEHVLGAQTVGALVGLRRVLGVEHELQQPRPVAQVDEDQPAVVAPPVHPAGHAHLVAGPVGAQLASPGLAVQVRARGPQTGRSPRSTAAGTAPVSISCCSPLSISFSCAPSSPRIAT